MNWMKSRMKSQLRTLRFNSRGKENIKAPETHEDIQILDTNEHREEKLNDMYKRNDHLEYGLYGRHIATC